MSFQDPPEDRVQTYYATPIQAMRLNAGNLTEAARWCGGRVEAEDMPNGGTYVLVPHLDGPFHARPHRWLIRTGAGEFKQLDHQDFLDSYQINPPRPPGPTPRGVSESAVPR